ncbi:MAG: hypothetical protein WCA08_09615 [Desulfoferrobacter sp.]
MASRTPYSSGKASFAIIICLLLILTLACGCSTPVGVKRVDPTLVHRDLTSNVLSTGRLSVQTQIVLNRNDLYKLFKQKPEESIAKLRAKYVAGHGGPDELSALAEASFLHAEESGKHSYYLASALYAYAFLFPDDNRQSPSPYDRRLRLACDLYNRGITSAFASADRSVVELRSGNYELPYGWLEVKTDSSDFVWNKRILYHFVPVAELEIEGLRDRYRWSGIGAPLSASTISAPGIQQHKDLVAPGIRVPVTALLRVVHAGQQIKRNRVQASLEIYDASGPEMIRIGDRQVPLEVETSASLAAMLAESPVWELELKAFLRSIIRTRIPTQLATLRPYHPGLIPVVFVHGTASSPGRWAEMLNELENDPKIRDHFQFWFFAYDTGNPIPYSAGLLRKSLTDAVQLFDPRHKDAALQKMIIIGHSQGGLLTKMTAIDSGNKFWDNVSPKTLDQLDLQPETRELLQQSLFYHPLPFVKTLIFIATPHRGSYIAAWRISHLAAKLIRLPTDILFTTADLFTRNKSAFAFASQKDLPTSIDNMTPGNPFIKTLASIPVTSGVSTHSIIAVAGNGPVENGNDGVVSYKSAHLKDADSEFVVRSSHSCQANPQTILQVRRILLKQIDQDR